MHWHTSKCIFPHVINSGFEVGWMHMGIIVSCQVRITCRPTSLSSHWIFMPARTQRPVRYCSVCVWAWAVCTVLTPFHSTLILTSSPPSGPLSYFTVSEVRLSRLRCFSRTSGSPSTSATRCLCAVSRPCRKTDNTKLTNIFWSKQSYFYQLWPTTYLPIYRNL